MSFLRLNFFIFLKTENSGFFCFLFVCLLLWLLLFYAPFLRFGRQSPSLSELRTCVKLLFPAFPLGFHSKDSTVILGPKDNTRDFWIDVLTTLHVHFAPGITHLQFMWIIIWTSSEKTSLANHYSYNCL